jgi:hypothetical protein
MINIFRTFNTDFNRIIKGKAVVDLIAAIKNGDTYMNVDTPILSNNRYGNDLAIHLQN